MSYGRPLVGPTVGPRTCCRGCNGDDRSHSHDCAAKAKAAALHAQLHGLAEPAGDGELDDDRRQAMQRGQQLEQLLHAAAARLLERLLLERLLDALEGLAWMLAQQGAVDDAESLLHEALDAAEAAAAAEGSRARRRRRRRTRSGGRSTCRARSCAAPRSSRGAQTGRTTPRSTLMARPADRAASTPPTSRCARSAGRPGRSRGGGARREFRRALSRLTPDAPRGGDRSS